MGLPFRRFRKAVAAGVSMLRRLVSEQSQILGQTIMIAGVTGMLLMLAGLATNQLRRQIFPA